MLKINLTRTSYDRPASPAVRRRTVDLSLLNRQARGMLKEIIAYRNADRGEGFYWSRTQVKYKVVAGYRQSMLTNMCQLFAFLKERAGVPDNALAVLFEVIDNLTTMEEQIKADVRPRLDKAAHEVMNIYRGAATSETSDYTHNFTQELTAAIKPYEARTLEYLKLIDREIDVMLSIFGLTRHTDPGSLNRT